MKLFSGLVIVVFAAISASAQSPDLLQKAQAGDIDSQLQLAQNYQFGIDGPKDLPLAIGWLRKAGSFGSAEALYRLGILAYNGNVLGEGVKENHTTAWACFEAAAVLGNAEARSERDRIAQELSPLQMERAQLKAAWFFIEGNLAPKNVVHARAELKASMNAKSLAAAVLLGMTYLDPALEPPNPNKATEYCLPAEKAHVQTASYCLGKAYEMKGDDKSAFKYFEEAAKNSMPAAMLNVAKRYHEGRGTKSNDLLAAAWAINAAEFEGAPELYRTLTANFTPNQIRDVQKAAAEVGRPARGLYYGAPK